MHIVHRFPLASRRIGSEQVFENDNTLQMPAGAVLARTTTLLPSSIQRRSAQTGMDPEHWASRPLMIAGVKAVNRCKFNQFQFSDLTGIACL